MQYVICLKKGFCIMQSSRWGRVFTAKKARPSSRLLNSREIAPRERASIGYLLQQRGDV